MEVVVGVKGRKEEIIEDGAADKLSSGLSSLKEGADPVVYKLVRVEFDGRFVPATDDELMEVENLLEHEKSEMLSVPDVMETVERISDKDDTFEKPLPEKHEGLSQMKLAEVDEDNIRTQAENSLPTSASSAKDRNVKGSGNTAEESSAGLHDGSNKNGSNGSKPNFSLIKGQINLDNLTIRELQETFRATFGRRTTVKDKMWLKRRIAMGLTNSYDVSVTSFIINDGKLLKKEELCKNMDCMDSVGGEICNAGDDGPVNLVACSSAREDAVGDDAELRNSFAESGCRSDDNLEHRAAKRARKPTKRYIEELSDKEKESSGKPLSLSRRFGQDKASSNAAVRPAWGVHTSDVVTRADSFGGSGVQVPYVSRIRRCRPRKSIMALTNFHSSDVALTRKNVESPIALSKAQSDDHNRVQNAETKSILFEEPIASEEEKEKQCLTSMSDTSQGGEPKSGDSVDDNTPLNNASGNNSDDPVATVPTAKGGMRRKHHRAWTLTEVMKLVDGVSKFGAGRWSEIKRLSFSSYSHRTSVDLKDKWRNLLKASFANTQADKGLNQRKNAPLPIPATILVKVRELAELNGQAPNSQVVKASSNNDSGSSVNENRSGYL